jgi:hypothetical protein
MSARGKFVIVQCCESMTFWFGPVSGYADPCLGLMDPDSDPLAFYFRL